MLQSSGSFSLAVFVDGFSAGLAVNSSLVRATIVHGRFCCLVLVSSTGHGQFACGMLDNFVSFGKELLELA